MYISEKASRIRQTKAQRARGNRAEIVKALSLGQITRRDLTTRGFDHRRLSRPSRRSEDNGLSTSISGKTC
jgi:hypothetical protein